MQSKVTKWMGEKRWLNNLKIVSFLFSSGANFQYQRSGKLILKAMLDSKLSIPF